MFPKCSWDRYLVCRPYFSFFTYSTRAGKKDFVKFRLLCLIFRLLFIVCQFIEKRREMKQEGRTEQELTESYCFLYPDKSKVQMTDKF